MERDWQKRAILVGVSLSIFIAILIVWSLVNRPEPVPEPVPEAPAPVEVADPRVVTIGSSIEGRAIETYTFGSGERELLFVGGIHGGYEWNSVMLAYEFIDHFTVNPTAIPEDTVVTIIPVLNPDGLYDIVGTGGRFTLADITESPVPGAGRFNSRDVDLNRNFDCKWQPESTWRGNTVSAGSAAFSEPEAATLRDYVIEHQPAAVVFWHSQANAVYASECEAGVLPATLDLMNSYAAAGGYQAVESFDAYPVSGDAEGWLASIGIPAITVELASHETIEWEKNLAGVNAVLNQYGR